MKLRFLYLLFYTDSRPNGFAGLATGPIVRICKDYKDDVGLEKHEAFHTYQWWLGLCILHPIFYTFCKTYRLWSEAKAYREQLKYPPAEGKDEYRRLYAEFISSKYGLDISTDEAVKLLQ